MHALPQRAYQSWAIIGLPVTSWVTTTPPKGQLAGIPTRLTPTERAAYVLREAFDYDYPEIARIVGVSPTATRQLVSRARKHLASERRNTVTPTERRALLDAFLAAARVGDVERLERLFAENVVTRADSNGSAKHVARVAVAGRNKVARVLSSFADVFWAGVTTRPVELNGEEAMAMERDGELIGVLSVAFSNEGLSELMWQLNPEKIAPLRRARTDRATPEG